MTLTTPLLTGMIVLTLLPLRSTAEDSLEQALLRELNRARSNPAVYAQELEQRRPLFEGKYFRKAGSPIRHLTREGVAAVEDAIVFLRRQAPLPPLQWSPGLEKAARELVVTQEQTGATGHGHGPSGMEQRIERHGNWTVGYAENIAYGDYRRATAVDIALQLIVDDGVPDRGHRLNIFSPEYALAGIACGRHPQHHAVCVIDFAGGAAEETPEP